ncbi:MAG: DUF6048 family protein [Cyclobacteriaceae bacterium]|nr:DUF6048 family protein [Cyclobacteriaceae bacterium]
MTSFIKYIVSILLLIAPLVGNAQDSLQVVQPKDSTQLTIQDSIALIAQDTIPVALTDPINSTPSDNLTAKDSSTYFAIYLSLDYGKLLTTLAQFENKYEFSIAIQFLKHLRATADIGYGNLAPPSAIQNGTYNSVGTYYRLGFDYMFTIAPKTSLSFGGMYALSNFKDQGSVEIISELWPSLSQNFERTNLTANWAEFIITSEAPILNRDSGFLSNIYWGIKLRLRFMIEKPTPEIFDVYAIPGYGRTFNNSVPAANVFISYKF